jgi:hypothetical protein
MKHGAINPYCGRVYIEGRKGFPIKKFNNRNIAPYIHKDNLSRFIDCLLYCSTGLEGVLQMLATAVLNIYAMQSQQAGRPHSHHLYN